MEKQEVIELVKSKLREKKPDARTALMKVLDTISIVYYHDSALKYIEFKDLILSAI